MNKNDIPPPKFIASVGAISLLGFLSVIFITLKLCGVIAWKWFWVLSPVWGGFAVGLTVLFVILLLSSIVGLIFYKRM